MSRVVWKGSISFGLVYVPVALYAGEQRSEIHFKQLDKHDLAPIGYQRVNKNTGKEVGWEDIVKGYEYEKGEFVVLSDEELAHANVEATQTVEIVDFVDAAAVPLLYFDKPYYLEPQKKGEKGYVLLRETLKRTGKAGIAKVVLRTRQYLAALLPYGDALVLELLRYADELRRPEELKLPHDPLEKYGISEREIEMAERLVAGMVRAFEPERYHDDFREDVMHLVEAKVAAGKTTEIEVPHETKPKRRAEVVDLMALLKKSVEEQERQRGGTQSAGRGGKEGGAKKRKRA